jgi:hypothetical protein
MRLRQHKMEYQLYNRLRLIAERHKIPSIDELIRVFMRTLYDEAGVIWEQSFIEKSKAQKEKNLADIERISDDKETSKSDFYKNAEFKVKMLDMRMRELMLKINHPRVINPMYEYESLPEWIDISLASYNAELRKLKAEKDSVLNAIDKAEKVYAGENEFDSAITNLKEQNRRIDLDIDRAERVLEIKRLLEDADEKTPTVDDGQRTKNHD